MGLKILHIIILSLPRSLKGSFPSSSPDPRMRPVRALHACSLDLFSCVRMRRIFVICQPASAQLLPSLRRSFLPDNSSRRGGGGVGPSHPRLSVTSLANGMADVQTRGANTRRWGLGSFGGQSVSLRVRSEKGRSGFCLALSRVLVRHPSHQVDDPCHGGVAIIMNANSVQFYPFPMEDFLLSFCSVTCCLVVMCNVHYSLFSFFGTTLISKPVSSNTDKQKEIKCPCCVEKHTVIAWLFISWISWIIGTSENWKTLVFYRMPCQYQVTNYSPSKRKMLLSE